MTVGINTALKPFVMPIDKLSMDPANERKHGTKNLDAIKGSLRKFGQQTPIVYDPNTMCILKGNGTFTAMREMGCTEIAAISTDIANNVDKTGYRIADNRSGELAEWDHEALQHTLMSIKADGFNIEDIGFDEWQASDNDDDLQPHDNGDKSYGFLIKCKNEKELLRIQNKFNTTRSSMAFETFADKVGV